MRNRKIFAVVLCTCLLCVLLTGCMRADIGITFNETDGGSIEYGVYMKSDRYNEILSMFGDPFDGETTETKLFDDEEYIGFTEKKDYDSADGIITALKELTFSDDILSEPEPDNEITAPVMGEADSKVFRSVSYEVSDNRCIFRAELNPQSYDEQTAGIGINTSDMLKLVFTVTMPQYISSTTAGTADDKSVVWEIDDLTAENSIEVVSQSSDIPFMAVIAIIGIVIIIVITILLISKKQKPQP